MANLLGDGFSNYVRKQINDRQKLHGKQNRTTKELAYLNSRTAWIKMVSGVSVDNSRLRMLGLENVFSEGLDLAKEFVLFNGISKVKTNKDGSNGKITQREGIIGKNSTLKSKFKNNVAYGLGGTEFGIVPMPGIIDLDINHAGTRGSLRKATVTIKAYNRQQLDILDVLYLRLGFTLLIEFGHNQYINNDGDIENLRSTLLEEKFFNSSLNKKTYLELLPLIEKKRFETCGNYDALFGRITNFKWSFEPDGTYNIRVDLYSLGDLAESLTISHQGDEPENDYYEEGVINPDYKRNVISDYLENIKRYYKYLGVPIDDEYLNTSENAPEIDEEEVSTDDLNLSDSAPTRTKNQIIENNLLNERAGIESNSDFGEQIEIDDIIYIKYKNIWFLKEKIIELACQVDIKFNEEVKSWTALNIVNDPEFENDIRLIGWDLVKNINEETLKNDFDLLALLGGNQDGVVNDYKSVIASGNTVRENILFTQIEAGVGITDRTGAGGNTPIIFNENLPADIAFQDNLGNINSYEDLQEVVDDNSVTIQNDALATGIDDYERAQAIENFEEILKGKKDIFYEVSKGYGLDSVSKLFGKVLNNQPSWKEPNLRTINKDTSLYPFSTSTADIIQLDYTQPNDDDYSFYIRFGTFLDFIREKVLYKIGDNNAPKEFDIPNTPIIDIDTDTLSNVMYTLPNQISLNQTICVVNNTFQFKDLRVNTFNGLEEFQNVDPFYGKVMNIYLNFGFIKQVMDASVDNKKIYLYEALSGICNEVNIALGGVNNLEPVIDEKTNCLKIIDSSRLPNIKEITNYLHKTNPTKYNYPTDLANFNYNKFTLADGSIKYDLNLFGYDVKNKELDDSNFIHNVDLSTSVTSNMSTMLAIGAASQGGYVIGEESTMFSKWNEGIHDRFNEPILNANGKEVASSSSFGKEWDTARLNYATFVIENFYKTGNGENFQYWGNTPLPSAENPNPVNKNLFNPLLIQTNLSIGTEFYRMLVTSASLANDHSYSGQPGFLPINLQISMDGMSGIKIYEKANIDISFLPTNYPETLDFLSTGLKHFLKDNKWETTLTTQATTIGAHKSNQSLPKIFNIDAAINDIEFEEISVIDEIDNSGYDDVVKGCPPPDNQKLTFVINNQQKADDDIFTKAQKLLKNIWASEKEHDNVKGVCARYVKNLAKKFWEEWGKGDNSKYIKLSTSTIWTAKGGIFTSPQSGTQDAKSKLTHDNLVSNFGYKLYRIGKGIPKADVRSQLSKINFFPGDIVVYWDSSNFKNGELGYQKYGHIQMYLGESVKKSRGVNTFLSDFEHSPFVYGKSSHAESCWNIILLKSRLNPIKTPPPPDPVVTNIGERASSNVFSPINKL